MRDTICHVGTSTSLGPSRVEESVANARLVAAAPDLLDVLILALPYVETATDDECYKAGAIPEMIKKIRAVIAKASGP